MRPKIIDCFLFYNELDLLNYRLHLLYLFIDHFIIVESNYTHAGNRKKLYYDENKFLFEKFRDKIIHIVIDLPYIFPNINYHNNEQWLNENFQRNSIHLGIMKLELGLSDLIIISDLDEIVDPKILVKFRNNEIKIEQGGFTLLQDMYYYNLMSKQENLWKLSKIITFEKYLTSTPQDIRINEFFPYLDKGGWHLSYFGNREFIKNKIKEFAHQEFNNSYYTDVEKILDKMNKNKDLFDRDFVPMKYVSINENQNLPPLYDIYLLNYIENMYITSIPIFIYFHIYCLNNWKDVVSNLLFKIKNSGLYNIIEEIRCSISGDYDSSIDDAKIKIIHQSVEGEKIILNSLLSDSTEKEFYVLYINNKNFSHIEKNVYDWFEYLSYFNIYHYKTCIKELEKYCTVGVNLQKSDDNLYYSGNFWWSKSSHIRNLGYIKDDDVPEFWITSVNEKYKSLWDSNINHYENPYPYYYYQKSSLV